jgi:hypothetical protein
MNLFTRAGNMLIIYIVGYDLQGSLPALII